LREAFTLVVIGLVIGVLASLDKPGATLLYELKPNDPLTIALATLLLAAVVALAGYVPARRAARVDPMVALRDE
jgi:ABC-type antimicrobial peptide transport system permease subunit